MPIVTLHLPDVKRQTEIHPHTCPSCHGATFQRWGNVIKPVKDQRHPTIAVHRYRCCHCHRTFRHYPEGVDQADQTQRLRPLERVVRRTLFRCSKVAQDSHHQDGVSSAVVDPSATLVSCVGPRNAPSHTPTSTKPLPKMKESVMLSLKSHAARTTVEIGKSRNE